MKYCIVEEKSSEKLEVKVNMLISEGWKPQGGINVVVVAPALSVWFFQQAMIKEG